MIDEPKTLDDWRKLVEYRYSEDADEDEVEQINRWANQWET